MPFDLLSPTGSMQYDFPVNYVFESLYAQNPGSDLQQLVVGQLYPAGTPIGYAPGLAQSTPWSGIIGIPVGLVSSSAQAATWTVASASVAQTAISASWAPGIGGATTWDAVSGKPDGLLSSSVQVNAILDADGVISSSVQVQFDSIGGRPSGLVSSSAQISYFGLSNVPAGIVSSSAQAATWTVASSSVATSASWAAVAVSASWAPGGGGGSPFDLQIARTGSVAGSGISVLDFTGGAIQGITITGVTASINISSGVATSASYAETAPYTGIIGRPTSSVVNSAWNSVDAVQQQYTIPGAQIGQLVSIHPLPPTDDPDEMEMDGIMASGYVSATNTVTVFLVANPGPISGSRPINIIVGV